MSVEFPTEDGLVQAVDGVSLSVERGKTLAIVGESGSGKSVTAQAIMGLIDRKIATVTGEIWLDGQELIGLPADDLQALRGGKVAMIFQDPMSSLHPFYRVGDQIIGGDPRPPVDRGQGRTRHSARDAAPSGDPGARTAGRRLPAPAVGRHAPARDDRDGAHQLA